MDYATIVLELLEKGQYPVLDGYVLIDIYYKTIPTDYPSTISKRYDRHTDTPEDVYIRDMEPFSLNYLIVSDRHFYMHRVQQLDTDAFPLHCITIKLTRAFLDSTILHSQSKSFEEEIYRFLTLLNYDVPRIAHILDLDFIASTRFLPQRIALWVFKYAEQNITLYPLTESERACFGPQSGGGGIPIRNVAGRLSECTSRSTLLSLNNHHPFQDIDYLYHYTEKWKTVIPLAFNPLENPIIH